ncbi:hypothetical protein CSUI_010272 [Cystoisospora suis]|uniref:Uncharacterized protein n=1 Tax=Cystoisospora suis TaxID=483139 RepID=A0A2C6KHP0_9APIC|nr:hypothetical protein CSUI_010272 [Cystoisospora suis]
MLRPEAFRNFSPGPSGEDDDSCIGPYRMLSPLPDHPHCAPPSHLSRMQKGPCRSAHLSSPIHPHTANKPGCHSGYGASRSFCTLSVPPTTRAANSGGYTDLPYTVQSPGPLSGFSTTASYYPAPVRHSSKEPSYCTGGLRGPYSTRLSSEEIYACVDGGQPPFPRVPKPGAEGREDASSFETSTDNFTFQAFGTGNTGRVSVVSLDLDPFSRATMLTKSRKGSGEGQSDRRVHRGLGTAVSGRGGKKFSLRKKADDSKQDDSRIMMATTPPQLALVEQEAAGERRRSPGSEEGSQAKANGHLFPYKDIAWMSLQGNPHYAVAPEGTSMSLRLRQGAGGDVRNSGTAQKSRGSEEKGNEIDGWNDSNTSSVSRVQANNLQWARQPSGSPAGKNNFSSCGCNSSPADGEECEFEGYTSPRRKSKPHSAASPTTPVSFSSMSPGCPFSRRPVVARTSSAVSPERAYKGGGAFWNQRESRERVPTRSPVTLQVPGGEQPKRMTAGPSLPLERRERRPKSSDYTTESIGSLRAKQGGRPRSKVILPSGPGTRGREIPARQQLSRTPPPGGLRTSDCVHKDGQQKTLHPVSVQGRLSTQRSGTLAARDSRALSHHNVTREKDPCWKRCDQMQVSHSYHQQQNPSLRPQGVFSDEDGGSPPFSSYTLDAQYPDSAISLERERQLFDLSFTHGLHTQRKEAMTTALGPRSYHTNWATEGDLRPHFSRDPSAAPRSKPRGPSPPSDCRIPGPGSYRPQGNHSCRSRSPMSPHITSVSPRPSSRCPHSGSVRRGHSNPAEETHESQSSEAVMACSPKSSTSRQGGGRGGKGGVIGRERGTGGTRTLKGKTFRVATRKVNDSATRTAKDFRAGSGSTERIRSPQASLVRQSARLPSRSPGMRGENSADIGPQYHEVYPHGHSEDKRRHVRREGEPGGFREMCCEMKGLGGRKHDDGEYPGSPESLLSQEQREREIAAYWGGGWKGDLPSTMISDTGFAFAQSRVSPYFPFPRESPQSHLYSREQGRRGPSASPGRSSCQGDREAESCRMISAAVSASSFPTFEELQARREVMVGKTDHTIVKNDKVTQERYHFPMESQSPRDSPPPTVGHASEERDSRYVTRAHKALSSPGELKTRSHSPAKRGGRPEHHHISGDPSHQSYLPQQPHQICSKGTTTSQENLDARKVPPHYQSIPPEYAEAGESLEPSQHLLRRALEEMLQEARLRQQESQSFLHAQQLQGKLQRELRGHLEMQLAQVARAQEQLQTHLALARAQGNAGENGVLLAECVEQLRLEVVREGERQRQLLRKHQMLLEEEERQTRLWQRDTNGGTAPDQSIDKTDRDLRETPQRSQGLEDISDVCSRTGGRFLETSAGQRDGTGRRDSSPSVKGHGIRHTEDDNREKEEENQRPLSHLCSPSFPQVSHTSSSPTLGSHSRGRSRERLPRPLSSAATSVPAMRRGSSEFEEETQDCDRRASIGAIGHPTSRGRQPSAVLQKESGDIHRPLHQERGLERSPATSQMSTLKHGGGQDPQRVAYSGGDGVGRCEHCTPQMQWIQRERLRLAREKQILHQQMVEHQELSRAPQVGAHTSQGLRSTTGQDTTSGASSEQGGQGACSGLSLEARQENRRAYAPSCRPKKLGYTPPATPKSSANTVRKSNQRLSKPRTGSSGSSSLPQTEQVPTMQLASMTGCKSGRTVRTGMVTVKATRQGIAAVQGKAEPVVANSKVVIGMLDKGSSQCPSVSSAEGAGRAAIVRGASGTGDVSATPRGDSDSARKRTPLQSQRLARQRLCEQKRLEQKAAAAAAAELQRKRENLLKLSEERRRRLEQHLSRQNSGGRGRARLRGKTHVSHHDTGKAEGRPASPSSSATGVDQSVRGEPQVTSVLRKDEVVKTSKSGSSCQFARETLGPAMVSSTSPSASSTKQRICVEEPRQKSPELSHGGGVVGQEGEKRESRTDGRGSDMGDVRPCSLTPGPWISADSGKATEGGSDVCRLASGLSVSLQNSGVCPGCTGLRRFLSHPSLHSTSSAFAANTVNRSHIPVPSRCVCHHHGSHGNAAASPPLTSDDVTGKREQQRDGFVSNPSSFSHQTHHNDPNVYISRGVGTQGTSSQPPVFLPCSVGQHMAPGGCAYRGDVCPYRNVVSLPHTCTSMIPGKGVPTPSTAHVVFFTPAGPAIGLCSHGEFRPPQGLLTPCHLSRTPGVGEGTCARCACGRALTQPPGEIRTERAENAKTEKEAAEEKEQEGQVWQSKQRVSPRRQDSPKVSERESFPVVTAADPENSRGEKKGGLVNSSPRKIPGQECLLRAVAERRKLESEPSHIRPAGVTEGPMTPERQSPVSSAAAASSMPRSEDEAALAARQARFELERQMTERLLAKMRQTRSQPQRQSPAEVACRADSQAKGTTTPSFRASSHPSHIDSSRHEGGRRSSIEEGEIVLDAVTQKTFVALSSPSTPVHGESGRVSVPLLEFHEVSVKPLMTTPDCREGASLELENSPEYPSPQSASKFLDAATSPVQVLHPSSSSRFRSCPSPCTRTQSSSYRVHPPLRGIREGEEESISERREREEADIRSPMERNQRCHQQVISPRGRGGGVLDDSTVNERGTGPRVSGRHVDICTGVPTYSLVSREIPLTSSDLASTTRHHSSSPRFVRRSYINEQESKMVRDRALSPVMVLSPRGHHNGEKQQYRSISCFPRLQPVDPRETTRAAPLPPHRRPPVISSVPYREPTVAQHLSFSSPRSSSAVPRLSSNSSLLNTAQPDVSPSVKSAPNFPARTGELSSPPALRPTRGTDLHSTSPATTRRLLRSPKSATSALASDLRNVSPCLSICQGAKSGNFNERSSAPLKVTDLRDGVSSRDSPTRHELFNTNVPLPSSCSSSDTKTHLTRASVPQQSSSAVTAHQGKSSGGLLQPTPSMSLSSPEALVSRLAAASKKCSTKQDLLKEMLKEICEIVREEAAQGNAPELALLRGVTGQDDSVEGAQGMMMNATALSVSKTLGASVTSSGGRCSENQEKYEKIETVVSQQEERFLSSYSQDLSPGMLCTSGKKGDEDEKNIHPRVQPSPSSTGMHASGRLLSSRSPMGLAGNFHESEKQDPRVLAGSKDVGMIGRSDSSSLGSSLRRSQLSSSLKEDEVFHPTGSPNALNPPPSSLSSSFRRAQDNRPGALSSSLFSRPASPKFRTPPLSPFPISAGVFSSSLSSPIGQEGSPSLGLAPSALSGGAVHQEEKKLEGGHIKSIREKKKQLPAALQPGALRSPRSPRPARHYSMSPPTNPISPVSEALSALKKTVPPDDVQKQEELVAAVVNAVMDKWRQEYGLLPVARGSREGQKKNKERSASEGEATDQVSEIEEKFFGRSVDEEEPGTTKEKSGKSKVRETCHLSGDLLGISAPVECECRSDGDKREVLQANKDSRRMKDRSPTFLCASSASSPRVDTPHLSNQGVDRRAATPREQLSASGSPVGNRSPSRSPFIFSSTCAEHPRSLSPTYRQQLPAFPRSISPPSHQKVQEGVKLQCPSSPRIDNFGVPLRHEKKEDMYRPENLPCAAAPDRAKQTAIVTAVCREAVALAFLGSPRDGRKGLMSPSSVQGEELSISGAVTLSPVPSVKSPAASCAEDRGQCRVVDSYADRNRTAEKTKDEVPDAKAKGAGGVSMRHGEGALCAEDGKKESPVRAKRGSPREGISIVTASHEVSLEPGEVTETSCMRVEETCVAVQRKRIEEGDGKRGDKGEVKDTSSLILAQLDEDRRRTPEFVDNISRRGNEEAVDGQRLSSMPCTHPSVVPAPSETKKEGMPHLRGSSSLSPPYNSHPSPWPQLAPIALSPTNKDGRSNGDVQQLADLEPGIDQKIDPTGRVPGSAFRVASLSPKREYGKPTALDKQAVSPSYAGGLHSPTDKRPRGSSVQRREKQSSESPLTSPRSVSPISPSHPAAVVPPTRVRHSAPSSPRSEREEVQLSSLAPTSRLISSPREADSSTAHRREIPPGICSPSSPSVALLSPCSRGQQQRSGVFASFETRQQAALLSPFLALPLDRRRGTWGRS